MLVPRDSQRAVVEPEDMTVLRSGGSVVMLVRFSTPWGEQHVAGAFLVLSLDDGSAQDGRPVALTVARILEPWASADTTMGRLPRFSPTEVSATVTGSSTGQIRIDVTHIVRRWTKGRPQEHGLALLAASAEPFSHVFATGAAGRPRPRLDVYVR
jgi:hypothetical protein